MHLSHQILTRIAIIVCAFAILRCKNDGSTVLPPLPSVAPGSGAATPDTARDFTPDRTSELNGIGLLEGKLQTNDTRYRCVATEIKDRCIVTATRCVGREMAYFQSSSPSSQTTVKYGSVMRASSFMSSLPTQGDISVMWIGGKACTLSGSAGASVNIETRSADNGNPLGVCAQGEALTWNPWVLSFDPLVNGTDVWLGTYDLQYAAQTPSPAPSGRMKGLAPITNITATSSSPNSLVYAINPPNFETKTDGSSVATCFRGIGGPVYKDSKLYGIVTSEEAADCVNQANAGTISAAGTASIDAQNWLTKQLNEFCRPTVSIDVSVEDYGAGFVAGTNTDAVLARTNSNILMCGKNFGTFYGVCSKPSIAGSVRLMATPETGFVFDKWLSDTSTSGECPCDQSINRECLFDIAALSNRAETYGVKCRAKFTWVSGGGGAPPTSTPIPSSSVMQSAIPSPTDTPYGEPSMSPSPSSTPWASPTDTPYGGPSMSPSPSSTPWASPTDTPYGGPSMSPSPSSTPWASPTYGPSVTPSPSFSMVP